MPRNYPMPDADAAWLHMDRPTNLMVINSVLLFDEPIAVAALRAIVLERIVEPFPRFRRVVVERGPFARPQWQDDPAFDVDLHIHRVALPAPGDDSALQALVADLMATPLDRTKPLWHVYLVEGYGDGCAVVVRMHHCIADGVALARVMLSMTDGAGDDGPALIAAPQSAGGGWLRHVPIPGPLRSVGGTTAKLAGGLGREAIDVLAHRRHLADMADEVRGDGAALWKSLTAPRETPTVLKGDHGVAQRVAWTAPLPLQDVKRVARATSTTVNDVVVAALSGALARYLERRDSLVDELHAMVPFNIRPLDEPLPRDLGNRFGLILIGLPIRHASSRSRLDEVHRRMEAIKASREPAMSYAILTALGKAPLPVEGRIIDLFTGTATMIVTNVPGPERPLRLADVALRRVLVWAPCAGSVAMSVSIFSYRGEVTVGFMTHASLVPDPGVLTEDLVAELEALRRTARVRRRAASTVGR